MYLEGIIPSASDTTYGIAKVDENDFEIDNDGVLAIKTPPLYSQATGTDDEIEEMIEAYYNGDISLQDVQSTQSIGDVRQANSTDRAKFKVASNVAPRIRNSSSQQTNVTIPEMTTVKWVIIDFDHSVLKTTIGSILNALVTIQMLGMISDGASPNTNYQGLMSMNNTNTNIGGQSGSVLYNYLNGNFYDACGFKGLIKIVKNPTKLTYNSDTLTQCEDKVFLLSEIEIFNARSSSRGNEGTQYKYFETSSNRVKNQGQEGTGSTRGQQERSIVSNDTINFCIVNSAGSASFDNAGVGYFGVAPACAL